VGPVLMLAPNALTNDRVFDFVGALEEDRAVLLDYLKVRAAGKKRKFPIVAKRFTRMWLRWKKAPLHFDDKLWPDNGKKRPRRCNIEIVVKDSALRIWRVG